MLLPVTGFDLGFPGEGLHVLISREINTCKHFLIWDFRGGGHEVISRELER